MYRAAGVVVIAGAIREAPALGRVVGPDGHGSLQRFQVANACTSTELVPQGIQRTGLERRHLTVPGGHGDPGNPIGRHAVVGQVLHHQESTERQYAFQDKAQSLGWSPAKIRVLDRDLGTSGTQTKKRSDFKTLVADVSLGQVGAVFALEASRLARSNTDWYRLIELCALTGTLIVDEDGCYDPADFNDALLLGLKSSFT